VVAALYPCFSVQQTVIKRTSNSMKDEKKCIALPAEQKPAKQTATALNAEKA